MDKEVAMTELDEEKKATQARKKYIWFGYGNYGGPNPQIGGGNIRDPNVFERLSDDQDIGRSKMTAFMWVIAGVFGLTLFVLFLAWGISLVVR